MLAMQNKAFQILRAKFKTSLDKFEGNGPTSKLWIQYYSMSTLIKQFIQEERMGDWKLHLYTVCKILRVFQSTGSFLYAKTYTCKISWLENSGLVQLSLICTQKEVSQFVYPISFGPAWSDLTTEETLMRSMKSCHALTQGRGISSSVIARWLEGMVYMLNICEEVERFCDISCSTGEQHIDMRMSDH